MSPPPFQWSLVLESGDGRAGSVTVAGGATTGADGGNGAPFESLPFDEPDEGAGASVGAGVVTAGGAETVVVVALLSLPFDQPGWPDDWELDDWLVEYRLVDTVVVVWIVWIGPDTVTGVGSTGRVVVAPTEELLWGCSESLPFESPPPFESPLPLVRLVAPCWAEPPPLERPWPAGVVLACPDVASFFASPDRPEDVSVLPVSDVVLSDAVLSDAVLSVGAVVDAEAAGAC